MIDRPYESDAPSLGLVLVKALLFWLRHQGVFWLMALPVAGLATAITYILESNRALVDWRHHWGWDFLFGLIYAMFLDRWIKEALLEDAHPCDEADAMRGSTIAPGFLIFAAALAAGEPASLRQAFARGRPLQIHLFLLIGGSVALWLLADPGVTWLAGYLPGGPWKAAAATAAHRLIDVLLFAFVGYGLATLFREVSGWQQPEPDARLYRCLS